jgi:hypothetical protein
MATSPNFSWPEPDNTDLVKNGALAIRTAVDAIDASMVDLKGGTTGQVLSKTSNTDMDFTWVAQDDSNAIQNAIVDAKGDIIAATANDTPARLAVGTANQVLTVDSTTATGLKWATPASGGGMTLLSTTTLSGTNTVINVASGYINLFVVISGVTCNANYELAYRINNIAGTGYYGNAQRSYTTATNSDPADAFVVFAPGSTSALSSSANNVFTALIENYDSSTVYKTMSNKMAITDNASALYQANSQWALFDTTAMTSLKIMTTGGTATFSTGTVLIYGVK